MRPFMLSLALFTGCAAAGPTFNVIRMGSLLPPLPTNCNVQFADAPAFAAMLLLTQVGMITAQVPGGRIDPQINEDVRRRACDLGGDVVTFNVAFTANAGNGDSLQVVQFLVFKKPAAQPPPLAPATQTTNL